MNIPLHTPKACWTDEEGWEADIAVVITWRQRGVRRSMRIPRRRESIACDDG